jgi:hypothetical protein
MKKKLEAELISIAHRILKLKNKSDLLQLHQETRNLYEKLSILKFAEENFGAVKPTIGLAEIEEKLETAFDNAKEAKAAETPETTEDFGEAADEASAQETEATEAANEETEKTAEIADEPETEEALAETVEWDEEAGTVEEEIPAAEEAGVSGAGEKAPQEDDFMPAFELTFDRKEENPKEELKETKQVSFEDLLGPDYNEPVFVKAGEAEDSSKKEAPKQKESAVIEEGGPEEEIRVVEAEIVQEKPKSGKEKPGSKPSLNDHLSRSITVGLNDRIGFEKQLFAGSSEDMNRVLSQLNTFDSFQEAQDFIEDMVKPDYNNWEGKDDYAQRFMDIVEKKFS